jgi:hypothetical protein
MGELVTHESHFSLQSLNTQRQGQIANSTETTCDWSNSASNSLGRIAKFQPMPADQISMKTK